MTKRYDLIIIGGGPGGYAAAMQASRYGQKILLIEKSHLGGVCLNHGCIPSKTLLHAAKTYRQVEQAQRYGVHVDQVRFSLKDAMTHKAQVITTLRQSVSNQLTRQKIKVIDGLGTFVDRHTVHVNSELYQAANIILATGSSPVMPPLSSIHLAHVLDSKAILDIERLPQDLVIIGGGVIGCEFASFFSQVGVNVSVVEMLPEILPTVDPDLAALLRQQLDSVSFHLGCRVEALDETSVAITNGEQTNLLSADLVLIAAGRTPNTEGLGLEAIGLDFDQQGIRVNDKMQTNIPGIYAVGDVNGRAMLAHAATRMGEIAVNTIVGKPDRMRYEGVPWVVYTNPEIASVGLSEAQAKAQGIAVRVAKMPMQYNGRFLAEHPGERGICKILVDSNTQVLRGIQMLGASCSEMIFGAAAMIEDEFRVQDIESLIFPHPTVSEVVRDTIFNL